MQTAAGMRFAFERRHKTREAEEDTIMETGLAGLAAGLVREESNIAKDRRATGTLSTDRCLRCGGFTVAWCDTLVESPGRRCIQCGEVIDPVILHNRLLQQTVTSGGVVLWSEK